MSSLVLPPSYMPPHVMKTVQEYLDEPRWGSSRAGRAGRLVLSILTALTVRERAIVRAYPYKNMRSVMIEATDALAAWRARDEAKP